jgi:hypothetical protein
LVHNETANDRRVCFHKMFIFHVLISDILLDLNSKIEPSVVENVKADPPEELSQPNDENHTNSKSGDLSDSSGLFPTKPIVVQDMPLLRKEDEILKSNIPFL